MIAARCITAALAGALALPALAQKSTSDGIAEYRKMLEDGNPAELFEAKGQALWSEARGPLKATLLRCDLGLGPGVVKGAWVQLPRYFADTAKVQDLESRLATCMAALQGFDAAELAKTPFSGGVYLGDWREGEKLAQNGRGMTWTDASAAPSANGAQCYNCHQISPQEISFGTIGPSLLGYGKLRGVSDPLATASAPVIQYTWAKIWNSKAYAACSNMPRFGHMGLLDEAQIRHVMALLLDPKSPVNQ